MKRLFALLFVFTMFTARGARAQGLQVHYPDYRLERSDVVEVKYRYTPEFDQTVTVGPDGYVSLEGIGEFPAIGLTVKEFRAKVVELSSAKLKSPEVNVTLKEFDKPHVYVEGEVNTPGRVDMRTDLSVTDAIAQSATTRVINVKKLVASHRLEEAVQLRPGDVIYVPQDGLSKAERIAHIGQFGAIYSPLR